MLDLGAGLGATTLGVAAFARSLGGIERLEVLASDHDARALDLFRVMAAESGRGILADVAVPIDLETRALDLEAGAPQLSGPFDVVVLGLVLNELFLDRSPDEAVTLRAALVRSLLDRLSAEGVLVVLEPALADTARGLQKVRDVLAPVVNVVAPCVDRAACPLLLRERDWCHEDLPLALPPALATLARSAGLRFEGASYAYLALSARPRTLAGALGATRPARVVGGPIVEKGRRELQLCRSGRIVRLNVLDRDPDRALDAAARGTVLDLDREPGEGAVHRHGRDLRATVLRTTG